MDWLSSGRIDSLRVMRVSKDMRETAVLDFVTGATVEYNMLTPLKATGKLDYFVAPDVGTDYVRVYTDHILGDKQETICHGTYLCTTPTSTLIGRGAEGTAELYGLLLIAQQSALEAPLSVAAGVNVVAHAKQMLGALGLGVVSDSSSATLNYARNYDAGTSVLEVVNDLLDYAGFSSAGCDAYGNVVLAHYVTPSNLTPTLTLDDSKPDWPLEPGLSYEFDTFPVPNKVIAIASTPDATLTATAANYDPLSPYSIAAKGYVVAYVETVNDVVSQAELEALAKRILADKSSSVESLEITHPYVPYEVGNAIRVIYTQGDLDFTGVVQRRALSVGVDGVRCSTRVRRLV
jgi:hypothetical protein